MYIERVQNPILFYEKIIPILLRVDFPLYVDLEEIYNVVDFKNDSNCVNSCPLVLRQVESDYAAYFERLQDIDKSFNLKHFNDFIAINEQSMVSLCEIYHYRVANSRDPVDMYRQEIRNRIFSLSHSLLSNRYEAYLSVCNLCTGLKTYCTTEIHTFSLPYRVQELCTSFPKRLREDNEICQRINQGTEANYCKFVLNMQNYLEVLPCQFPSFTYHGWDASAVCGWPLIMSAANFFGGVCHDDLEEIKDALKTQSEIDNKTALEVKVIRDQLGLLANSSVIEQNEIKSLQKATEQLNENIHKLDEQNKEIIKEIAKQNDHSYRLEQIQYIYDKLNSYYLQIDRILISIFRYANSNNNLGPLSTSFIFNSIMLQKLNEALFSYSNFEVTYRKMLDISVSFKVTLKDKPNLRMFISGTFVASKKNTPSTAVKLKTTNIYKTNGTVCVGGIAPEYLVRSLADLSFIFHYEPNFCVFNYDIDFCYLPPIQNKFLDQSVILPCSHWFNTSVVAINTSYVYVQDHYSEGLHKSGLILPNPSVSLGEDITIVYEVKNGKFEKIDPATLNIKSINLEDEEIKNTKNLIENKNIDLDAIHNRIAVNQNQLNKLIKENDILNKKFQDQVDNLSANSNGWPSWALIIIALIALAALGLSLLNLTRR